MTIKRTQRLIRKSHRDLPASVGLVQDVRSELKHEMKSMEHRLDAKIEHLDAKMQHLDSNIERVLAKVDGISVLMEEQRSENRIVLDGIKLAMERIERLEVRVEV